MVNKNGYMAADELDALLTQLAADPLVEELRYFSLPEADVAQAHALATLAARIEPDRAFAGALERHLLQRHEQTSPLLYGRTSSTTIKRRRTMHNRKLVALAGVAALLLALFFGLSLWPDALQGPQAVSAAELLSRANAALAVQAEGTDVIYDRLALSWDLSGNQQEAVTGELWQSADGNQVRYQLTDPQENLLYFYQRNGERVWHSIHTKPVGVKPVSTVYEATPDAGGPGTGAEEGLLRSDISTTWTQLNEVLAERQQTCLDLYCLLGLSPETVEMPAAVLEITPNEGTFEIEFQPPAGVADMTRSLIIDGDTYAVLEITDLDRGNPVASLRHVNRQVMSEAELPENFFENVPVAVDVREQEESVEVTPPARDRVWIIDISPQPGAVLEGPTQFEVVVGYDLISAPKAALHVNLARPGFDTRNSGGRLPVVSGQQVEVTSSDHEVTVTFMLDAAHEAAWMGQGELAPWILMGTFQGATSLEVLAGEHFTEYAWTMDP